MSRYTINNIEQEKTNINNTPSIIYMTESPFYYQTCFYRNMETRDPNDQTKYIVLASIDQVIDKSMMNGAIDRHELLQVFSEVLNPWDIESGSGIVEYVFRLDDFQLRENRVFTIR